MYKCMLKTIVKAKFLAILGIEQTLSQPRTYMLQLLSRAETQRYEYRRKHSNNFGAQLPFHYLAPMFLLLLSVNALQSAYHYVSRNFVARIETK